ncbi:MAG: RIP metalloprotease RseP [Halofilum sp. (in: g-proteobacteria)]
MLQILLSIAAFIVAIGVLVTVHEYGHYRVARWCGVRVLRFSVGFGRPLWKRTYGADRTEWVIAAIPLGGYVKMLDEREGEVDAAEAHRAFNRQSVGRRAAIVAAGPAVNIALAAVAYSVMFMIGVQGAVPRLGEIAEGSPAAEAGFERGDLILAVDGIDAPSWSEARLTLLDRGLDGDRDRIPLTVRTADGYETERRLDISGVSLREDGVDPIRTLGFQPWLPDMPPRITSVMEDSAAAEAGLKAGDVVVRAGDTRIRAWSDWVAHVQARPGEAIPLVIERDGERIDLEVTPSAVKADGGRVGQIGARGPQLSEEQREKMYATVRYGPIDSVIQGTVKTWDMSTLTVRVLTGLVTGSAALSNISGPVSIAQYAGQSAQVGLATFLGFLALISVSIGLLNLLPIPVLDGGHLLYYAVEAVKGSPVSERVQVMGQQLGLVLLFALMTLALYNDFVRLVY